MLDQKLLSILVCPLCKGSLHYNRQSQELICLPDAKAFPVREDVPVMLGTEARELSLEETEQYR